MWKQKAAIVLILTTFLSFLMTPVVVHADGGTDGMETEVNGYHLHLVFPEPIKVGENSFQVEITAPDGSPVHSAEVSLSAQPVEKTAIHQMEMGNTHGHDPAPPTRSAQDDMGDMDGMEGMGSMDAATATPENMDAHEMAGMDHDLDTQTASVAVVLKASHHMPGEYSGTISIPTAGHWMATIHFTADGDELAAEFPLEVASNIPASYGILAGFFGLNVAIVATAAVTRRKATHA